MKRAMVGGVVAAVVTASAMGAFGQGVVVAKQAMKDAVKVTEDGRTWTLDNGIVKAVVNKRNGDLENLWFRGIDTMGHDQGRAGYWEEDPSEAAKVGGLTDSVTIDPAKNGGERAEVAVKGITKGQVGLTPGSPGGAQGGTMNLDLELRVAMGRGESGVHVYGIFSHPKEYGALSVPESRYITKINQAFDWISVDADRNMLEAAPTDWGEGVVVHAKEQRIMNKGVYKNSVEHKYSYTAVQYKTPAYGWSSTKEKVGIWFINPTIEYLSGGASKCELDCHFGDNGNPDPIILDYWRGTHYSGGASANVAAGEEWSKVIGPIYVYCNALEQGKTATAEELKTLKETEGNSTVPASSTQNATALWQDALRQAKEEKAAWPYDWVQGVEYAHKNERANVKGQLVLEDPLAPPNASKKLPHLMVGLAHAEYAAGGRGGRGGAAPMIDWKHDAKHYQFWNDGAEDGTFTITMVRPGTYKLYAFADGVLGEFEGGEVKVEAGKDVDLGKVTWKPVRNGKTVWEIGYPDRTAREFFKGDGANYWLWGWPIRYGALFPNDVTFTIGKSDPAKDWFFEEVPHETSDAWKNPEAKDPANQRFGWVKGESLQQYPQTNTRGPWAVYGQGKATTWTVKFAMEQAVEGQAFLRVALCGADGAGGLAVGVNGKEAGTIRAVATNALRYNTDQGVWHEYTVPFDAGMLKAGENEMTFTVPAGEVTSGVVWDYLRLEVPEK